MKIWASKNVLWKYLLCCLNKENCCSDKENCCSNNVIKQTLILQNLNDQLDIDHTIWVIVHIVRIYVQVFLLNIAKGASIIPNKDSMLWSTSEFRATFQINNFKSLKWIFELYNYKPSICSLQTVLKRLNNIHC